MRRRLLILTLMLMITMALSFPTSAFYADCSVGGQVDRDADDLRDNAFSDCCDYWGCPGPMQNYCTDQGDQAYNGHVISKNCLNLAY